MERANAFERSEASTSDRRLALHLLRSIVQLHKTEQNQGRDYFSNAKRDVESVWPHSQGGNQTPQSQNKETDQKRRPSVLPEPRLVQLFRRQRHYRSPAGDAQWATLNLGAQVRYSPPKLVVRVQISATACLSLSLVPVPVCLSACLRPCPCACVRARETETERGSQREPGRARECVWRKKKPVSGRIAMNHGPGAHCSWTPAAHPR